jgi:hypothetical protein
VVVVGNKTGGLVVGARRWLALGEEDDVFVLALAADDGAITDGVLFGSACGDQGRALVPSDGGTLLDGGSFGDPGNEGSHSVDECSLRLGDHTLASTGNADGYIALLDRELVPKWIRGVASPGFTVVKSAAAYERGWVLAGSEQRDAVPPGQPWTESPSPLLGFVDRVGPDGERQWHLAPDWVVAMDEVRTDGERIVAAGYWRGEATVDVAGKSRSIAARALAAHAMEIDAHGLLAKLWTCDGEADDRAIGLALDGPAIAIALDASRDNDCVADEGRWIVRLR